MAHEAFSIAQIRLTRSNGTIDYPGDPSHDASDQSSRTSRRNFVRGTVPLGMGAGGARQAYPCAARPHRASCSLVTVNILLNPITVHPFGATVKKSVTGIPGAVRLRILDAGGRVVHERSTAARPRDADASRYFAKLTNARPRGRLLVSREG